MTTIITNMNQEDLKELGILDNWILIESSPDEYYFKWKNKSNRYYVSIKPIHWFGFLYETYIEQGYKFVVNCDTRMHKEHLFKNLEEAYSFINKWKEKYN